MPTERCTRRHTREPADVRRADGTKDSEAASVPPSMALKAAVFLAVREAGISNSEFARRMRLDEKEVRRILDPHHPTKLPRIEEALSVLGRHVELSLA